MRTRKEIEEKIKEIQNRINEHFIRKDEAFLSGNGNREREHSEVIENFDARILALRWIINQAMRL